MVRHRRIVRTGAALGADFLEDSTTFPGVSTGLLSCCHIVSFHEQLLPARYVKPRNCQTVAGWVTLDVPKRELGADFAGYRLSAKAAESSDLSVAFFL